MGGFISKDKGLKEKIRLIEEQINGVMNEREKETEAYEREMVIFAFKKAGWKRERKKMRKEVKKLKEMVKEKEDRIREMEEGLMFGEKREEEWEVIESSILVQQMNVERACRDEALKKWKQLYLSIKFELDHLIQRTHNANELQFREHIMEELKDELQTKEETIKTLKAELASMEQEKYKRDRDIDILRQSLRITNSKKPLKVATHRNFLRKLSVK